MSKRYVVEIDADTFRRLHIEAKRERRNLHDTIHVALVLLREYRRQAAEVIASMELRPKLESRPKLK